MRGCITLRRPRILGARLHIHWSAFVASGIAFGAFIRQPIHAVILVACYFGLILLHEAGHALMAKRLGYEASDIYLTFIHGLCVFEHPDTLRDDAMIAWGGVLAQFLVAVPLMAVHQTLAPGANPLFSIIVAMLGYMSVLMACFNLAPAKGLDGHLAWRLIPILIGDVRNSWAAKRATKDIIRRLK